jgi:hypothetical protein
MVQAALLLGGILHTANTDPLIDKEDRRATTPPRNATAVQPDWKEVKRMKKNNRNR